MKVSEIFIHPVKSMRGQKVDHAEVTTGGLAGDRMFTVVPVGKDVVLTARQKPVMVGIAPRVEDGYLVLEGPDDSIAVSLMSSGERRDVKVWNCEVDGMDMGDEVATWLGDQIGQPVRLLAATAETVRRSPVSIAPHSFVDLAPLLVTTQDSLADLNTHLETPVSQRRFRPNIVIEGTGAPWDEDTWTHIRIGDVELEITFGCARCALPDVDDGTAEKVRAMPVNKALRATRLEGDKQTYFGQNARVLKPGTIKVGDTVEVLGRRERQLLQAEGKAAYPA